MNKILVVIPAYNEEASIEKAVTDLKNNNFGYDYVIINDGSTDNTKEICLKNKFNMIDLVANLGIGGCMQTGYRYALMKGYKYVIQFDGDGQHNAKYIKNVYQKLKNENLDMVIGSRFINGKGFKSSVSRRIGIKFFRFLIYLISKKKVTDPTSGFRIFNEKIISEFCNYYPEDYPEPESIVYLLKHRYLIDEEAVVMNERAGGVSSINFFKAVYYMIKVSLSILLVNLVDLKDSN
ncbi:glycosyltransferase family 2 protein [Sebaldella sp. S0638]|uniref:glycosyltransferase family 2 protein n=1 Tax=Sebaldella sp. S0638 TaxID=2957809 RepID=UPI0020A0632F|nr:glycosyltransferase family 2 protein [Sebaldella sp. S0638]MCP1225888.1 glycosyltransferase family 2 protein [Sebaldella sp. S0638]